MNATRWERVRTLFEGSCDLTPPEREEYLARACDDDDLRAEVEAIALASDSAPSRFDEPLAGSFPELLATIGEEDALVGRRLGAYEVVRRVASGGMGAVYLATRADGLYERRVAIKVIRPRLVTERTLERFRRERQVLADLVHPFIAPLFDSGVSEDDVPYIVMEYVDGVPIDRFCREQHLDVAARLSLFRKVCAAVAHAHGRLVVHRDLKPTNILVRANGEPVLLDFGLAEVLDPGREGAASAAPPLTPGYASPEQVRGEPATTSADVYSLGVVLYELLTGAAPYETNGLLPDEVRRTVCEVEPMPPSTALASAARERVPASARRLRGDLDAIVLEALRKAPTDRYRSVEALSDDVGRHLARRPVRARKSTAAYRFGCFARRNPVVLTAIMTATVVLVGALAVVWSAGLRIEHEALETERINAFLGDVLASADLESGGRDSAGAMIDEATRRLEAGDLGGGEAEAAARLTIGLASLDLGRLDDAQRHVERALAIREGLVGSEHPAAAEAMNALGRVARHRGEVAASEQWYRAALEVRIASLGLDHIETAQSLNDLGVLLKNTSRAAEAEELLERALDTRRAAAAAAAADPLHARRARGDLATTMTNLAAVRKTRGDLDGAQSLYEDALELFRATLGSTHYRVATALNNLALVERERGRLDEAEAAFREALEMRRGVFGDEHLAVATGRKNLALVLAERGALDEAESHYREALRLGRTLSGDPMELSNTLTGLADVLASTGALDEAEALCREGLEIRRERDPNHERVATSLLVLGRIALARGDASAAEPLLREALERYERQGAAGRARAIDRAKRELARCMEMKEEAP